MRSYVLLGALAHLGAPPLHLLGLWSAAADEAELPHHFLFEAASFHG